MIKVTYEIAATAWSIRRMLKNLKHKPVLAFDTETAGLYTPYERDAAKKALKSYQPSSYRKIASLIANNSGLSYPSLVRVTHFVFGISENHSKIIICNSAKEELPIWNWMARYEGIFAVHNTLFDLKIMKHRVNVLPKQYDDTQIMAKCLINHSQGWKAKVGLKDLMGSYYEPAWTLFNEYEPENPRDPKFLKYCATDGAATFKLYELVSEKMSTDETSV